MCDVTWRITICETPVSEQRQQGPVRATLREGAVLRLPANPEHTNHPLYLLFPSLGYILLVNYFYNVILSGYHGSYFVSPLQTIFFVRGIRYAQHEGN